MNFIDNLDAHSPVLIAGPTASGKSALAIEIAMTKGGMIVNADALQVWSCWRVLSARPDSAEEALVPHRLYGHRTIGDGYSAGHWLREVRALLDESRLRPIFVGGTGLYLTMLTQGMADIPPTPPEVRNRADQRMATEGAEALLTELDPDTRARIDARNPARVQRAWEVQQTTGRGLADWQADTPPPLLPLASCRAVVIDADRDWLGQRIDARFDKMIAEGALDEVRAVLPLWDEGALWAQAIGAPELMAHLRGEIPLDAAVAAAKTASRQYAKRQRTWLRNRMASWQRIALP